jgi:hypothetical protein
LADAIDEQGFDIGLEFAKDWICIDQILPGFEGEEGFGCAGGAGEHGDNALGGGIEIEEGEIDGEMQVFPQGVGHLEIG